MFLSLNAVHPQWRPLVEHALTAMDPDYLQRLHAQSGWLPGSERVFAAFSQPLEQTQYILLGESPYPRLGSANGYAFWDQAVDSLWGQDGLSKTVNRATSLRNFIKMLLHARGDLSTDFSKSAIALLDKHRYVETATGFFQNMMQKGFLLLNASLVYEAKQVPYHARQWRPFLESLLNQLHQLKPQIFLILLGKIAEQVPDATRFSCLTAEHPYNLSFMTNPDVIAFFKPLDLLRTV